VILPCKGVAALHTGGYRGLAQFAARRIEKGSTASWTMEKDVAASPRPRFRIHASYFSYLLQCMKKFTPSWHVHSAQSSLMRTKEDIDEQNVQNHKMTSKASKV